MPLRGAFVAAMLPDPTSPPCPSISCGQDYIRLRPRIRLGQRIITFIASNKAACFSVILRAGLRGTIGWATGVRVIIRLQHLPVGFTCGINLYVRQDAKLGVVNF